LDSNHETTRPSQVRERILKPLHVFTVVACGLVVVSLVIQGLLTGRMKNRFGYVTGDEARFEALLAVALGVIFIVVGIVGWVLTKNGRLKPPGGNDWD
jgi:hypothetical protein